MGFLPNSFKDQKDRIVSWPTFHDSIVYIQHTISFLGTLIILSGILWALFQFIANSFTPHKRKNTSSINQIRLDLGRTLILGLEFIVAADLIATTITPDYYSLGIVAGIVLIRTILIFSLNRELIALRKET